MSTADQRGWGLPPIKTLIRIPCPGLPLWVHTDVAVLFETLVSRLWEAREREKKPPLTSAGGYNFRPIRGQEDKWKRTHATVYLSNHSWGLAADFNPATNPYRGKRTDMPRNTAAIAESCGLVWGGTWRANSYDPMHFEYVGTRAEARVWSQTLRGMRARAVQSQEEPELNTDERRQLNRVEAMCWTIANQLGITFDAVSGDVKVTGFPHILGVKENGEPRTVTDGVGVLLERTER